MEFDKVERVVVEGLLSFYRADGSKRSEKQQSVENRWFGFEDEEDQWFLIERQTIGLVIAETDEEQQRTENHWFIKEKTNQQKNKNKK